MIAHFGLIARRNFAVIVAIISLISVATEVSAAENNWPCWMGPDHNGISNESLSVDTWPEEGLQVEWTRDLGIGFSSMSIANGRLYSMGNAKGKETVFCLDAKSGETVWAHSYESALVANLYEGGPGSTPTVDGQFVYTLGKEGQLFCLDAASGEIQWQKDLQLDLDVPMPEWGFNSSARVIGENVFFEAGRVVAYNQLTGEKRWQSPKHAAGYGSVAELVLSDKTYLITLDCDALRVTDPVDGNEVATYPWKSPFGTNSTTPIVQDDSIFVSTGYQAGCGLFRFDGDSLELVYSNRDMRNHFNNCILYDGYLYGFDGNSNLGRVVQLVCMNYATGEVAWEQAGHGCGSVMIVDGKLLILSDEGTIVIANATPKGYEELATSAFLEGRCWTIPVYLDGYFYGRNAAGKLVAAKSHSKSGN